MFGYWYIQMSIQSWEYVDPSLASTYIQLQKTKASLATDIHNLQHSNLLDPKLKAKLIEKNKNLEKKVIRNLETHKSHLIDYFDRQTIVLTKEEIVVPQWKTVMEESTVENSKIARDLMDVTLRKGNVGKKQRVKTLVVSSRSVKKLERCNKYQKAVISNLRRQSMAAEASEDEEEVDRLRRKND